VPGVWHRYTFPSLGARNAYVYKQADLNQWVRVDGSPPATYQIVAITEAGAATFSAGSAGTPAAHATTHQAGGTDPIALDTLAAPTDVTTLNASSSKHGLLPKLPADATKFLDGTGAWTVPAGSGSGSSSIDNHPASAHADNEEFETTGNPSGWVLYDHDTSTTITPSGLPDPYSNPGAGTAKYKAHTDWRSSWGCMQLSSENHDMVWCKPITPVTNMFIWTRLGRNVKPTGGASGENQMLCLLQDVAGKPDFDNGVFIGYRSGAGTAVQVLKRVAGAITVTAALGTDPSAGDERAHFGLQKIGTNYYGHALSDNGADISWAATAFTGTIAWVGYYIRANSTAPGANLFRFDYLRRVDSAQGLPI
jgi:hypothetical protein